MCLSVSFKLKIRNNKSYLMFSGYTKAWKPHLFQIHTTRQSDTTQSVLHVFYRERGGDMAAWVESKYRASWRQLFSTFHNRKNNHAGASPYILWLIMWKQIVAHRRAFQSAAFVLDLWPSCSQYCSFQISRSIFCPLQNIDVEELKQTIIPLAHNFNYGFF